MIVNKNIPLPENSRSKGSPRLYEWEKLTENGDSSFFYLPAGVPLSDYRARLIASFRHWKLKNRAKFSLVTRSFETDGGRGIRIWRLDDAK